MAHWPALSYERWAPCCDTVHAITQVLGKLSVALAPPEPQLQHAALRLTPRGWETAPLPAPDGSGAITAGVDLTRHRALVEHSDGGRREVEVVRRPVAEITRGLLDAVAELAGAATIDATPQEVDWPAPLDEDRDHAHYEPDQVAEYFAAATQAALVLAAYRAPYRSRATPVNAWWGSFDLAVNLFSGQTVDPPADDFIMRNAMDAQEIAVGWWPGNAAHDGAAFYAYAYPAPDGFGEATLQPDGARWDAGLGEFVLEWSELIAAPDPRADALAFARSAFLHASEVCGWSPELAAPIAGERPPVS